MILEDLRKKLVVAWCAETARGTWNSECPPMNQCCVTALVVQDYFGGKLLKCPTKNKDIHYWNRLDDGTEVDLTYEQFATSGDEPIKSSAIVVNRNRPLAYQNVLQRYNLLKERLSI